MSRESLTGNSKYAMGIITNEAGHRVGMQSRTTTGGTYNNNWIWQSLSIPRWIRLKRAGNSFSTYHGTDGTNWTLFRTETVSMPQATYVGFAVAATNQTSSATGTFSNFDLTQGIVEDVQRDFMASPSDEALSKDLAEMPKSPVLEQNYPNPFNPTTKVAFHVPESQHAQLTVVNVLGEIVRVMVDDFVESGRHEFTLDARNLPSGMYFYVLRTGTFSDTRKMTLLR